MGGAECSHAEAAVVGTRISQSYPFPPPSGPKELTVVVSAQRVRPAVLGTGLPPPPRSGLGAQGGRAPQRSTPITSPTRHPTHLPTHAFSELQGPSPLAGRRQGRRVPPRPQTRPPPTARPTPSLTLPYPHHTTPNPYPTPAPTRSSSWRAASWATTRPACSTCGSGGSPTSPPAAAPLGVGVSCRAAGDC